MLKNLARGFLPVLQIRGSPRALAKGFCGGIDRDKNNIGVTDTLLNLGRKKEIAAPRLPHHLVETGLIDRQVVTLPGRNTGVVDINNRDFAVRTAGGNHGHGRPADIAGSNTQDIRGVSHNASLHTQK